MKTIWIVGKVKADENSSWTFHGAFDDQYLAENSCTDGHFFVWPWVLNAGPPGERNAWNGAYYPRLEPRKPFVPMLPITELKGRHRPKKPAE